MRILVVEPLAAEGVELLRRHHEVDERIGLPREEIAAILPDYDALVVRSQVKVDAELIAAATRLVVIGRAGVAPTTSISRRPPGQASSSSTPRPATRSRPPS